jgi:hypothetical protein
VRGNQGRLEIATEGGAGRRPAKGAAAPINQAIPVMAMIQPSGPT